MKKEIKDLSKEEQKEYLLQQDIKYNGWITLMFLVSICILLIKEDGYKLQILLWLIFSMLLMFYDLGKLKKLYLEE